ncbi:hypothetical protein [Marinobacter fuscus]|uniref:hypothetical protein n=1 Tax=Marinobacter fuscus TaxID=2109942 RepID=UPI0013FE143E|nr:hypothetical protein [Marinobacter fuscus]
MLYQLSYSRSSFQRRCPFNGCVFYGFRLARQPFFHLFVFKGVNGYFLIKKPTQGKSHDSGHGLYFGKAHHQPGKAQVPQGVEQKEKTISTNAAI